MKEQLLLGTLILSFSFYVDAQTLTTEDFNSYTVGNITTATNGSTPGQGGYILFSSNGGGTTTSTNSGPAVAQIVPAGLNNNALQMTGPNGSGGGRFLWKNGLGNIWATRPAANNIIEVEVDINPGALNSSKNLFGVYIYAPNNVVLAGFLVRAATREVSLVTYSFPEGGSLGNNTYDLGIFLPANTTSRIGISFNKATGEVRLKGPGLSSSGASGVGSAMGMDPIETDFIVYSGTDQTGINAAAASMVFDNLVIKASNIDTLLKTENDTILSSLLSIYPNPASGVITVKNTGNIPVNSIAITDLNGRTIKSMVYKNLTETQINIADLSPGVYMVKVASDQGTTTKKMVKQ